MVDVDYLDEALVSNDSKIVLLVLDGVGGLPRDSDGKTELEAAETPNFDDLASEAETGLHVPVREGVIPGSGPGHLGLFGYDPIDYRVGRGVLSGLGIGFDLRDSDVAARGNFCTLDEDGIIQDRRAGRISTETNERLCEKLRQIELPGAQVFVETVKEHRFLLVLRGKSLGGNVKDTDPSRLEVPPKQPVARDDDSERTANLVSRFVDQATEILKEEAKANGVILRGFSKRPRWPNFRQRYRLNGACLANYPMYRGVSRLVGMNVLANGVSFSEKIDVVEDKWGDYDFFFLHEKQPDATGEDGDFDRKVSVIEEIDSHLPALRELDPDVLLVTGDHSTPAKMSYHSWHPVPTILASENCRPDPVEEFGERPCLDGGLGVRFPAKELMPLALAHARRLTKFGA